jgi:tetratricopeptide (TPR) repeat protein
MVFTRLLKAMTGSRQPETVMAMFRQAGRHRDAGRFEEAVALVERGLKADADNIVGHLMAGSLHAVFREMDRAKAEFERVLTLDPGQPRALLGLARIAMEQDENDRSVELLHRALGRYPDFPEAAALLAVVTTAAPARPSRPSSPAPVVQPDRLRVPSESRETLIARSDSTLVFAQPRSPHSGELATRTAHLHRLAAALVARAGLGALHHAIIEGAAETTYLRTDGDAMLSLTFGRDIETAAALTHLERVWTNCRAELSSQVA